MFRQAAGVGGQAVAAGLVVGDHAVLLVCLARIMAATSRNASVGSEPCIGGGGESGMGIGALASRQRRTSACSSPIDLDRSRAAALLISGPAAHSAAQAVIEHG
jgi:hypothetical protein